MEKSSIADKDLRWAIIKTILYADLFDYPLSKEEIWKYLIVDGKQQVISSPRTSGDARRSEAGKKRFEDCLSNAKSIDSKNGLYFLCGKERLSTIRTQRKKISLEKMKIAKSVAVTLAKVPTVLLIAVSGALAMENAHDTDDIDFFVVVSTKTIWITRLFLLLLLHGMGMRRKRSDANFSNKICLNMLVDKAHVTFSKDRQDVYTAHEVFQMKPIFERNGMSDVFVRSNMWVNTFLPNAFVDRKQLLSDVAVVNKKWLGVFFIPLEFLAKKAQLFYMSKHKTTELIIDGFLAFHPFDYRKVILQKFQKQVRKYATI